MSFESIKGQVRAKELLKSFLKTGHIAPAYLFVGPEGIGKFLCAVEFAKALNCESGNFDSCGVCASCIKVDKSGHPDVHIIGNTLKDEEGSTDAIKIEEIRQLQKDINYRPYEGNKSIFIINNAHTLTAEASNALLKVLEEPPAHGLIILVTAKPVLLFKTIVSRCQMVKFSPLLRGELESLLQNEYSCNDAQSHFLAYFCEGRLGSSLKLLKEPLFQEKNAMIDEFMGINSSAQDSKFIKNRVDAKRYLNIIVTWLRDLYLLKTGLNHTDLIHLDRKNDLLSSMHKYSLSDLEGALNFVSDSLLYVDQNVNVRLLLANLRYCLKG